MHEECNSNDLQEIISCAIEQMKQEAGEAFDRNKINLAELERRTHISRSKLRTLKKNDFIVKPHGRTGQKAESVKLTGYTDTIDSLLRDGVSNSQVCYDRIVEQGYEGKLTQVKVYIAEHRDLIPAKRMTVSPQGNRGRRYHTGPGESYQMDWGFTYVLSCDGTEYRVACFAMICHHCGTRYIEFFPNAKQENLFIGMIHAFFFMGVPKYVLTDNMKSVVTKRDSDKHPIWQKDYEVFMNLVKFQTKLCKPRHPFTKGAVERLIRFVKDNFLAGRIFTNVTELNYQALQWCNTQNGKYHRAVDCVPMERHKGSCLVKATPLMQSLELGYYLCPKRRISFDGFVNYEGRRFGVPYWYTKPVCRISRKEFTITVYSDDLKQILTTHDVTWSRRDSFCSDQYLTQQPEELPTTPITTVIRQVQPKLPPTGYEKFNFEEGLWNE